MLEHILKLYVMAMAGDVRSPLPHLEGPPGCGKSTVIEQLAQLVGKKLHTINVSRLSPLEIEGVQMPMGMETDVPRLHLLLSTLWSKLEEGDIILFDEFLRGFPEVYNALLDIITSRTVAGHVLPRVFIIAASNSAVAYDAALEDRILHLPVPDPRKLKTAKRNLAQLITDEIGLMPEMRDSMEMQALLDSDVLPMFNVLDTFKNRSSSPATLKGYSIRNLIGQAKLREVQSTALKELIDMNNHRAATAGKWQYVVLIDGKKVHVNYAANAAKLPAAKLTKVQALNLNLNNQLIGLEEARREKGIAEDDDSDDVFDDAPF